jgi:hypothetical protein
LPLMVRSSAAAGPASRTQAAPDATRRMVTGKLAPRKFPSSRAGAWQNANAERRLVQSEAVLPHV